MRKIALLVGVSEYALELRQLPKAEADLEALRRVLLNPGMGEFDDVQVLLNPQRQAMEEAIEQLFQNRQKDDLLLLYFSGHGIKDDFGKLYLSTPTTRTENGKLVKTSAVAASFLHEQMGESRSERQVIILDSCFSGAIAKGMTIKDDGSVDLQAQLGGKGRAILTAATSTQYAFEGDDFALSIYTHFLVEGMEKGAADLDDDGLISVDELHQYVFAKVKETAPAMTPEFYPVREGHRIVLCKSPRDDSQLKYRKEVERRVEQGRFTVPGRKILNRKRVELGLSAEVAGAIEAEVLRPHQEFQQKLKEYEECLTEALAAENPLSERALGDLRDFQKMLGLRDEDVRAIEVRILALPDNELDSITADMLMDLLKEDLPTPENTSEVGNNTLDSITADMLMDLLKEDLPTPENTSKVGIDRKTTDSTMQESWIDLFPSPNAKPLLDSKITWEELFGDLPPPQVPDDEAD